MNYEEYYKKYIKIFEEYVSKYDRNDALIELKRTHSYRVAIHAAKIAESLKLEQKQIDIAYICGLFHDIGRFEQAKQSHTYDDRYFQDHGDYGAKVLEEKVSKEISEDERIQNIVILATKYHNKYEIGDTTEEESLYCKIVRDADKIDIMEYQVNEIDGKYPLDKDVVENILNHKLCRNGVVNNKLDHLLRMLCFIYDMHYIYSFKYILDSKILDKKFELMAKHSQEDVSDIINCINEYLKDKINKK